MYRNEKGFTIAEGLVSLGAVLFVSALLLPLVFQMLIKLNEFKEELVSYRLLYEAIEHSMISDSAISDSVSMNGQIYEINVSSNLGKWKACVFYENQRKCITETTE